MKKLLTIALVGVLALSLVACGGKVKDGTYTAQASAASHDWTSTLAVTYADGKVTAAAYDAFNAAGEMKSAQTPETYPMEPAVSKWIPDLNAAIVAAGTADKIEAVAGATNSSNEAKVMMAAVEAAAKKGDTNTVMVDMPASK